MKANRETNGPDGKDCLKITVSEPQYNFLTRTLVFPAEVAKIVFSGEALSQGIVKGPEAGTGWQDLGPVLECRWNDGG